VSAPSIHTSSSARITSCAGRHLDALSGGDPLRRPLHRHAGKNLLLAKLLFLLICLKVITSTNIDKKKIFMSKSNQLREDSNIKNFENVEYITFVFAAD
jgi:hypothetical protein